LVLAEKRTALSTLRTGIAIFAFPLSVLSVLIATSKSYNFSEVLHWMIPLLLLNLGLIVLAIYLIVLAFRRIRHYDRLIEGFKRKYGRWRNCWIESHRPRRRILVLHAAFAGRQVLARAAVQAHFGGSWSPPDGKPPHSSRLETHRHSQKPKSPHLSCRCSGWKA